MNKTKKLADNWAEKENKRIKREYKQYGLDLKTDSGKTDRECAITAMTLAHHGTTEALEALKKFKQDKRAPDWIDCAIDECEQMLWDDTVGIKLHATEEKIRAAAENVFAEKLVWDKQIITDALKACLTKQKIRFTYGNTVQLKYEDKIVGEDKLEFVIDDVLLVGIKPNFSDWLIRFKQGLEGKDLTKGDLENIEQGMNFDDDGKKLAEPKTLAGNFNEFYENQFYNLLEISKLPEGILLDFSQEKIYGKYFSLPLANGWHRGNCSGWCEGCFEEIKCETAQENKTAEDEKKYRILKQILKEIVEIENKIEAGKRPAVDWEYQIETAKKIKEEIENNFKKEKDKGKSRQLKDELFDWQCEISSLENLLGMEQPKSEDVNRLKILKKMYEKIKGEVITAEYKNDVEGLEIYYGKKEPKPGEEQGCYHDPLCDCDELEQLSADERIYDFGDPCELKLAEAPF